MFAISAINSSKTCNREEIENIQSYANGGYIRGIGYHKGRLVLFESNPSDELDEEVVHIRPVTLKESLLFQAQMQEALDSELFPDSDYGKGFRKWYTALAAAIR